MSAYGQSTRPGFSLIKGKEYENVASRLQRYVQDFPEHAVTTKIVRCNEQQVIMRAEIHNEGGRLIATGHAEEKWGSSQINGTSALENGETSAIGRALATRGYGGTEFASANEVANAIHQQQQPTQSKWPKPAWIPPERMDSEKKPATSWSPPEKKPASNPRPQGARTTPIRSDELASPQDREDFFNYYSCLELKKPGAGLAFLMGKMVADERLANGDRQTAINELKANLFQLAENYVCLWWIHWRDDFEKAIAEFKSKQG